MTFDQHIVFIIVCRCLVVFRKELCKFDGSSFALSKKYAKPNPPFKEEEQCCNNRYGCTLSKENEECKIHYYTKCKYKSLE